MQDKLLVQSRLLNDFDLVISDCILIDASGALLADSFFELRGSGSGFLKNLYKNSFLGCCMAFRRSILEKALPFPADLAMHDTWLGLVAELYGTTYFCPKKLVHYRRHSNTATETGGKSSLPFTQQLSQRWTFLYHALYRKLTKT
jgi:GT2 family glycosyltransferase